MGWIGYGCALVLAAVFARAGAAKLARHEQTAASFVALRLPAARRLAQMVPVMELALAVTLVAFPPVGGVASLVLLAGFSTVLVRAIRSGSKAPCNCFGTARAAPVSVRDVLRNVVLAALALAAAFAVPAHFVALRGW